MKTPVVWLTVLIAAFGILPFAIHGPASAMSSSCSNADSMMMKAHAMIVQSKPVMTGDVDKDFVSMEIGTSKAQVAMARAEMMCGSRAADKASAAALLSESEQRLRLFRNQGTSL